MPNDSAMMKFQLHIILELNDRKKVRFAESFCGSLTSCSMRSLLFFFLKKIDLFY